MEAWNYIASRHTVMCQQPRKMCSTKVLFTGTTKSPFSTPRISLTINRFLSNLLNLCPPYTQLYIPNLKEINLVVFEIYISENCPIFLLLQFKSLTLSQEKQSSYKLISFKFGTPIRHIMTYCSLNL